MDDGFPVFFRNQGGRATVSPERIELGDQVIEFFPDLNPLGRIDVCGLEQVFGLPDVFSQFQFRRQKSGVFNILWASRNSSGMF